MNIVKSKKNLTYLQDNIDEIDDTVDLIIEKRRKKTFLYLKVGDLKYQIARVFYGKHIEIIIPQDKSLIEIIRDVYIYLNDARRHENITKGDEKRFTIDDL